MLPRGWWVGGGTVPVWVTVAVSALVRGPRGLSRVWLQVTVPVGCPVGLVHCKQEASRLGPWARSAGHGHTVRPLLFLCPIFLCNFPFEIFHNWLWLNAPLVKTYLLSWLMATVESLF